MDFRYADTHKYLRFQRTKQIVGLAHRARERWWDCVYPSLGASGKREREESSMAAPIQQPLSLILKLKTSNQSPAAVNLDLSTNLPDILHFAWVISLASIGQPTTLLLSTVYDGDFDVYLDKFIDSSHAEFDAFFPLIQDGPPTPVLENRRDF